MRAPLLPQTTNASTTAQISPFLPFTYANNNTYFIPIQTMTKPSKSPKHSKVSSSISSIPPYAVATAAEMDRKVYIPLCFCLISFAVMVYVN